MSANEAIAQQCDRTYAEAVRQRITELEVELTAMNDYLAELEVELRHYTRARDVASIRSIRDHLVAVAWLRDEAGEVLEQARRLLPSHGSS